MSNIPTIEYLSDMGALIPLVVGKRIVGMRTEGGWPQFVFNDGSSVCFYTAGESVEAEYAHSS